VAAWLPELLYWAGARLES